MRMKAASPGALPGGRWPGTFPGQGGCSVASVEVGSWFIAATTYTVVYHLRKKD